MRALTILVLIILAEIATFIEVGDAIGAVPVIALVLASGLGGLALIRRAGIGLEGWRHPDEIPAELAGRAALLFSGILLLVPGLLTSTVGLLLLVPPVRDALFRLLRRWLGISLRGFDHREGGAAGGGDTVEGTFTRLDPDQPPRRPGQRSPWN